MKLALPTIFKFSLQNVLPTLSKYFKWFFVILFFMVFIAGIYDWYINVYQGEWTNEQKQSYAAGAFSETILKENLFQGAVSSVSRQSDSYKTDMKVTNDIFKPLPKSVTTETSGQ